MNYDLTNALFEFGGAVLGLLNIRAIWKHRAVQGIHPATIVFSCLWTCFVIPYYVHHADWFSVGAATLRTLVLAVWVGSYAWLTQRRSGAERQ